MAGRRGACTVLLIGCLLVSHRAGLVHARQAPVAVEAVPESPEERQRINDRFVERLRASIAGREREPASRVFKNIRFALFKKVPAGDLLGIMDGGYSKALGVTCTHCHIESDFASDQRRPKRAARAMAKMHRAINQALARMDDLASEPEERFINCGTCHRGSVHPQQPSR